jgi:lipopolysaccharide/colanic/teichoic acid biosynthesis glycosyltransferase
MIYQRYLKRVLDITMAVFLLLALSPLFLIIFLILVFVNHGSPFFLQNRPGHHGKPFRIIKFKTMNDNQDKEGNLLPDIKRLTKIGLLLRKTSLDEMPQLLNILKGDLSMVGPRPLLMQYLPHYSKEQSQRHNVKPGITGWAQVNGRQSISYTQRFELDVWYVRNISFKLDVIILVKTFLNVLKSKGVVKDEPPWKE